MTRARGPIAALLAAALAVTLFLVPISPRWIERGYANGIYAALATTLVPLVNRLPFALGDVLIALVLLGFVVFAIRRARRGGRFAIVAIVLGLITLGGALGIWFQCAWGLNYRRIPVAYRVDYDAVRVNDRSVAAFARTIVAGLNRTAPAAHREMASAGNADTAVLEADFLPVVARLGDTYRVRVSTPKTSFVLDRWFQIAGIGGMFDPFAYETILNSAFLPFERPFALAHEWGHVAGFTAEGDANLIAALTCLRSHDPLIRYSGLFWIYGYLPGDVTARYPVSAQVRADADAAQARFLRYYQPRLYSLQWRAYDTYLRANRVAAGVRSYNEFTSLLVGTPLDAQGLPIPPRT
jgi:hypothetical protein